MKVSLVLALCLLGVARSGYPYYMMFMEVDSDQVENQGQPEQMRDQRNKSLDSRSKSVEKSEEEAQLDAFLADISRINSEIESELLKNTFEVEAEAQVVQSLLDECRRVGLNDKKPEDFESDLLSWGNSQCHLNTKEELAEKLISYLIYTMKYALKSCDQIDDESKAKINKVLDSSVKEVQDQAQLLDVSNFLAVISEESLQLTQEKSEELKKLYDYTVKKVEELCSEGNELVAELETQGVLN